MIKTITRMSIMWNYEEEEKYQFNILGFKFSKIITKV